MQQYGEKITAYIEDPHTGAMICPYCELEMAIVPGLDIVCCGSGVNGDGHYITLFDARND